MEKRVEIRLRAQVQIQIKAKVQNGFCSNTYTYFDIINIGKWSGESSPYIGNCTAFFDDGYFEGARSGRAMV